MQFVKDLIWKTFPGTNLEIEKVIAGRQWNNIDVWAEVTCTDKNYLIIIEDKVFTGEHSGQLEKYKKSAEEWCAENNFELVPIYLKTGSESDTNLKGIKTKGFEIFSRQEFIKLLEKNLEIRNDIFIDFKERLKTLHISYTEFENKILDEWTDLCWIGFYQLLENEIKLVNWGLVNNPAGGFWNAVLNWEYWNDFPVYIQIEQGKLCFKISTDPEEVELDETFDKRLVREQWSNIIIRTANALGQFEVRRPDRFGYGKYMTVAIVDREYWLGHGTEKINSEKVIRKLKKYKEIMFSCLKLSQQQLAPETT
jgi:hypothetical protein